MKETTKSFLNLFFNPGETICVSDSEYGYHSIEQSEIGGEIKLISPSSKVSDRVILEGDINLIALNPIKGFRDDVSVTSFRSFLVEMDGESLQDQVKYVKEMEMPYSVCVFSGNKSMHFGIVLDQDMPSEEIYRVLAEWILNIMKKADQVTKNPSRSIRFPGNKRKNGRELIQSMIELKQRVSYNKLSEWLNKYPEENPTLKHMMERAKRPIYSLNIDSIPVWVMDKITKGIDPSRGRNNEWSSIAFSLAKAGYSYEEMRGYLEPFFEPDVDFKTKEWLNILKSAHRKVMKEIR